MVRCRLIGGGGGEGEIRKNLIEANIIDCMVALPRQLFYSTQIPACLWFISPNREQKGKVLFINAQNMGQMVDRTHRELTIEDINKIADTYHAWRNGNKEYTDILGFCKSVELDEIRDHHYVLTPGRYVEFEREEDDIEMFEEKMARLVQEWQGQQAESSRLDKAIEQNFRSLGFIDLIGKK